ncbi:uncharacterized protein V6R79_020619 [Siganus canaliculatus]
MATGPDRRVEEQPPALPVKKHRSHSSRLSSVESDCALLSPTELQYQSQLCNDVFPEPTDCNATQCPIHQRYDPSQHQMRFFSDGTPPPVPKKRLTRTLSLPGISPPSSSPLSPLSPRQRRPLNFDNPLYMLAPIPDSYITEDREEFQPVTESPVPFLSMSQLCFDTPDEHLSYLFSTFEDQKVVFQGIQYRHLLFLRSVAQSIDAGILLQGDTAERDVNAYHPDDFLLREDSEPQQIGDAVYYSVHSPKLPGRLLALRVYKQTDEASVAPSTHLPPHVNVQDIVTQFHPSDKRTDRVTGHVQDVSHPSETGCSAASAPSGGSTDGSSIHVDSLESILYKGHSLAVERDLPQATLEDFVVGGSRFLDYDRRVCVLLLQILLGLKHLHSISCSTAELRPREIFLVWPKTEEEEGGTTREHDDAEVKTNRLKEGMERGGKVQTLWRTHGAPRVVLSPLSSPFPGPRPSISIKSQIGALIQFCLHAEENPACPGSGPARSQSSNRRELLHLASVLQSESSGPQMEDMVAMLQVLLWGPRMALFDQRRPQTTAVHNWLTIKRALLVMKLAEKGLVQDHSVLDWEDCLCLHYLSFTDPETVVSVSRQLCLQAES